MYSKSRKSAAPSIFDTLKKSRSSSGAKYSYRTQGGNSTAQTSRKPTKRSSSKPSTSAVRPIKIKTIKEQLRDPEIINSPKKLRDIAQLLVSMIDEAENKQTIFMNELDQTTNQLHHQKLELDKVLKQKKNAELEQENLKEENLQMIERIRVYSNLKGYMLKEPSRTSFIQAKTSTKNEIINSAFQTLGLKKVVTQDEILEENDRRVIEANKALLKEKQELEISLRKLKPINLKAPGIAILLRKFREMRDPNLQDPALSLKSEIKFLDMIMSKTSELKATKKNHDLTSGATLASLEAQFNGMKSEHSKLSRLLSSAPQIQSQYNFTTLI